MCIVWPERPCPEHRPAYTRIVYTGTHGTTTLDEPATVAAGCTTGSTWRHDTGCEDAR
jgi:hypothetical protein